MFGEDLSDVRVHLGRREPLRELGAEAAARDDEVAFASATPDKGVVAHEVAHILQYRVETSSAAAGDAEAEAEAARGAIRRGQPVTVAARPARPVSFLCSSETPQNCFDGTWLQRLAELDIDPSGLTYPEATQLAGLLSRLDQVTAITERGEPPTLLAGETLRWTTEAPCTTSMSYRFSSSDAELMVYFRFDASRRTPGFLRLLFRHVSGRTIEGQHLEPATGERGSCIAPLLLLPTPEELARRREADRALRDESRARSRARRERFREPSAELLGESIAISGLDELDRALTAVTDAQEALDARHTATRDGRGMHAPRDLAELLTRRDAQDTADWVAHASGYADRAAALAERNEFMADFRDFAIQVATTMLERSYNLAIDEFDRYLHRSSTAEVAELFDAMAPLRSTVEQIDTEGGDLIERFIVEMTLSPVSDPLPGLRRDSASQQWYLRRDLAARFPVIAPALTPIRTDQGSRMHELARIHSPIALRRRLATEAYAVAYNVGTARRDLRDDPDLVWQLDGVIARAKELAGIAPGSISDRLIDEETASHVEEDARISRLLAVLSLALGAASGGIGTVAAGATVASAGLSGYLLMQSWRSYDVLSSAAGTAIGEERALASTAPWIGWLILDIVGLGLDLGAVGALFASSSHFTESAIRAARATGEEGEAALRTLREEAEAVARERPDLLGGVDRETFVDSVVGAARREQEHFAAIDPVARAALADSVPAAVRADPVALDGLARLPDETRRELIALLADDPETLRRLGELAEVSPTFRQRLVAGDWRRTADAAAPIAEAVDVGPPAAAAEAAAVSPPERSGGDLTSAIDDEVETVETPEEIRARRDREEARRPRPRVVSTPLSDSLRADFPELLDLSSAGEDAYEEALHAARMAQIADDAEAERLALAVWQLEQTGRLRDRMRKFIAWEGNEFALRAEVLSEARRIRGLARTIEDERPPTWLPSRMEAVEAVRRSHDFGVRRGQAAAEAMSPPLEARGFVNPLDYVGDYGNGFDDVRYRGGVACPVEYKGGGARLAPGQMSSEWVYGNIQRLLESGQDGAIRHARDMLAAWERDELVGYVFSTSLTGRTRVEAIAYPVADLRRLQAAAEVR